MRAVGAYKAGLTHHKLTPAMRDLIARRTAPFLDTHGCQKPLTHLLQEAYLQGMTDAVEASKSLTPKNR